MASLGTEQSERCRVQSQAGGWEGFASCRLSVRGWLRLRIDKLIEVDGILHNAPSHRSQGGLVPVNAIGVSLVLPVFVLYLRS